MHNLFLIFIVTVMVAGSAEAGIFSRLNPFRKSASSSSVPQKETRNERVIKCSGELKLSDKGDIIGCTDKFFMSEDSRNREERRMNMKERLISFINNLTGWLFWGFLGLVFFFPSAIGVIFGRVFNNSKKALVKVARAIQRSRKNEEDLTTVLNDELDQTDKKLIRKIKEKNFIK